MPLLHWRQLYTSCTCERRGWRGWAEQHLCRLAGRHFITLAAHSNIQVCGVTTVALFLYLFNFTAFLIYLLVDLSVDE